MFKINYVYLFIHFYLLVYIKCIVTDSCDKTNLHNCSSIYCSHNKLSNIYENSKYILTELENLLYDLRDEKNSHQLENELDKKLDFEIKFPISKDYDDLTYLTSDEESENESKYREPVPYITIDRLNEDLDDMEKSLLNYNINKIDNSANRPLQSDEEIDVALSRIHDFEEQQKNFKEEMSKYNFKRYLRSHIKENT
ncbi:conserved Plasmodium protein, unknown function [Plasmodium relictum]|uniref:Fam-b protein n=1 Tax=Plasmodium relictum TaxID=85471 RepID=A0A1J1HBV7_PLARL|nr:conserved Plasmodium protein, unknown function [Plasmodium relictum]CRH02574.1 conserved Plasmodium protein, unknown function [Plasmodium relictum]